MGQRGGGATNDHILIKELHSSRKIVVGFPEEETPDLFFCSCKQSFCLYESHYLCSAGSLE